MAGPCQGIRRRSPGPLASRLSSFRPGHPTAHGLPPRPPPGRRAGGRRRHSALPAGAARRRAGHGEHRARLRRHELRLPRGVAVPARGRRRPDAARLRRPPRGPRCRRPAAAALRRPRRWRSCSAGCSPPAPSPITRATGGRARWSASPARRSASRRRARCSGACGAGSIPTRPTPCPSTPRESRSLAAGLSILFPPLAIVIIAGLVWLLVGSRRRAGEKYAGLRILR